MMMLQGVLITVFLVQVEAPVILQSPDTIALEALAHVRNFIC